MCADLGILCKMATPPNVSNFYFLEGYAPLLARLPALAERYLHDDPNTAMLKLRQFAELLARQVAARVGLGSADIDQLGRIRELEARGMIDRQVAQVFHAVRRSGNEANHAFSGSQGEAVHQLKHARQLAIWFHRTFGDLDFTPGPFVRPAPPIDPSDALRRQLDALQADLEALKARAKVDAERAQLETELRRLAEARAAAAEEEAAIALELATEVEHRFTDESDRFQAELSAQADAAELADADTREAVVKRAIAATAKYDPSEDETRHLIDEQLRAAGWEVDSQELRHGKGARPVKGRARAIAEWPTAAGPADYVLFYGLTPIAVVEAKRERRNVAGAIEQSKRYSRGYAFGDDEEPPAGGPWQGYNIPFLFSTNGRPFLRQLKEYSGVWFLDARRPTHHARARDGWASPDDLLAMLRQDVAAADQLLAQSPSDYLPLRSYQHDAVRSVEQAIAEGKREILLAMATGTGKTRTCIGLIYRLIKAKRFRRVLFLVDRRTLGDQASEALQDVRLENQKSFHEIYDIKALADLVPETGTKLQIATIQSMVQRILYSDDGVFTVDSFDCLVVDECHRGYTLDRELGEQELTFRDEADYISKYRRVLDYFDAVKIGLTATPALHTSEIFGKPIVNYSYRRAVVDGYLVDHEPPIQLRTGLAIDGILWKAGDTVETFDPVENQIELFETPDELHLEIESFNKRVITEPFNRAICSALAEHIDPSLPGKTLIFCVTDSHADMVVRLLKEAFADLYGSVEDDAVRKITGYTDKPSQAFRRFKNERLPSVAVTVDYLTTGIDVPEIVHIVFLRRVKSRILYEQMMGRATRLCEGLYGDRDKEYFYIYDAVGLYQTLKDHTDMKPVVQDPSFTFEQLVGELLSLEDPVSLSLVKDQLVAKLQRKRKVLERSWPEAFETVAGCTPSELIEKLKGGDAKAAVIYFSMHKPLVELLDTKVPSLTRKQLISHHPDKVRAIQRGYGEGAGRPEDYLDSFGRFLDEHVNEIEALKIVMTRPRELTRHQLKELKLALDRKGFNEAALRTAYRESTNQDIAASIIGYIRQRALGTPLEPYDRRVDRAVRAILARDSWKPAQRQWLERIGKQLVQETVVDREALDQGQFRAMGGGYDRLNHIFGGRIDEVLGDLHEEIWHDSA